jgi:hypothetical protein
MEQNAITNEPIELWISLADQFLDGEARHEIPWAAWRCLQAGLSLEQARNVWRYEVTPAVWPNIWSVAGEWGCWHREWLIERIRTVRTKPGYWAYLRYRCQVHLLHRVWLAVERCIALMLELAPEQRGVLARDLVQLGEHYVDYSPKPIAAEGEALARLEALESTALAVFELVAFDDRKAGPTRVRAALAAARQRSRAGLPSAAEEVSR